MLNSRRDDTGLYTLRVDNEHGSDSADVSVVVMVPMKRFFVVTDGRTK